jgi:subtilisin family serine protease
MAIKERCIILKAPGRAADIRRGGLGLGGPFAGAAAVEPTSISVDVTALERGSEAHLARDRDVLEVAPVMPMRLIAPVATDGDGAAAPAAPTSDWGIRAVGADTSPFTGDGILVAVLDTGIDRTHPAFAGMTLVEKDFTGEGDGDIHGHGTHCAGTIFGRDVNGVRIGVARGVQRALVGKILGRTGGDSERIVEAIQWARSQGATVISMSVGIDFPGYQAALQAEGLPPELATSRALEAYRRNVSLFEKLTGLLNAMGGITPGSQPTVMIAAAGNESRRQQNPDFKIAVSPPAVADGIISVAAVGQEGNEFVVAPFSNTGALVAGPGVGITSAAVGGGLRVMSGTSMATPYVAGVSALWAQRIRQRGNLTAAVLSAQVIGNASLQRLKAGFDPVDVGSGLVQAPQN